MRVMLLRECFHSNPVCACVCLFVYVCVRFSSVQRPCVCVCEFFLSASIKTVVPKPTWTPKSLVTIYRSHCLFLFAKPLSRPTLLPFLTRAKAPQWPLQALPPVSPTNYWSSFILLRAEPAWNHSICVSLKVWLREMESWLPSLCLITAVRGWRRTQEANKIMCQS